MFDIIQLKGYEEEVILLYDAVKLTYCDKPKQLGVNIWFSDFFLITHSPIVNPKPVSDCDDLPLCC